MINCHRMGLDCIRVVWLIVSLSFVSYINNISRVSISSVVGHNLGAAIRKGNTVLSGGGIAIPVLVLGKVDTRVVISHSITILVDSWLIIRWLLVSGSWVVWCWLVHNRGWVVDWSWVGNNHWCWVIWSWPVDNREWVDWSVGGNNGRMGTMGFVDRVAHCWSIAVLDDLMAGLVGSGAAAAKRAEIAIKAFIFVVVLC